MNINYIVFFSYVPWIYIIIIMIIIINSSSSNKH